MSVYKFKIKFSEKEAGKNKIFFEKKNLHPDPTEYRNETSRLIILGSPIYGGKINKDKLAKEILGKGINSSLAREIDGSFLLILYEEQKRILIVINDRFASIPFYYYYENGTFIGCSNYSEIISEIRDTASLPINRTAFYEFMHFQRLLGEKTYDTKTRYFSSATILSLRAKDDTLETKKYWEPAFLKRKRTVEESSHTFAEMVSRAVAKRTGSKERYGILLSGGLDSRLVLASLREPVECVTVGSFRNNEFRVAEMLAKAKGYSHSFVKRPESHYGDMLDEAIYLGGGMNVYNHAHFLNLDSDLKEKADVYFHGYGFDYMFQGKYLPYTSVKIGSKATYIKRIAKIKDNIKDRFFSGISYRLKSVDPILLLRTGEKERMKEAVYSSIEEVLKRGREFCNDIGDLWEYLVIHNLSRHYTFLNIDSIRTFTEERTVAFDNELFDFYLSLSATDRAHKRIFVEAIRLLDRRLYRIRNANTNFNIYDSESTLTAKTGINRGLNKVGFRVLLPPAKEERSWPSRANIISGNPNIKETALALGNSDALDSLGFLDMDKLRSYITMHFDEKGDYSDLILTLITIERFLKKRKPYKVD